ncbi:hypothetical protein ACOJEA_004768 [Klebsiella aerogenes]
MITVIMELLSKGMDFFIKKKTVEKEVVSTTAEGQIEVNKIEVEKNGIHWRNVLGLVLTLIILYSYILIPFFDFFGIVLIQLPLDPIFRLLMVLLGGM